MASYGAVGISKPKQAVVRSEVTSCKYETGDVQAEKDCNTTINQTREAAAKTGAQCKFEVKDVKDGEETLHGMIDSSLQILS